MHIYTCVLCLVTQLCPTLCDPMDCCPPGSSVCGDSPNKNTGVGCYAPFQRIIPTQGWNPGLPHCRWILYCLNHQGSPRLLEWVAYPFFRGISWAGVSCIAGGFFTVWATWEAPINWSPLWARPGLGAGSLEVNQQPPPPSPHPCIPNLPSRAHSAVGEGKCGHWSAVTSMVTVL